MDVVARLRETQADIRGRAFLLKLDFLIIRLGAKWESKAPFVHEYLHNGFADRFQEPNWCAGINGNAWIAVTIGSGPRAGALACAEIWNDTVRFFIGADTQATLPLFENIVEDANRVKLRTIDLNTYFDRDEDFDGKRTAAHPPAPHQETVAPQKPAATTRMIGISGASFTATTVQCIGRNLRVACTLEPVFELKQLTMIGNRLEPIVIDTIANVQLEGRLLRVMDWQDKEQIDLENIFQGIKLLEARTPADRKVLIVIPMAFSTLASTRGRTRAMTAIANAAADLNMKALIEIRGLSGVPQHRILEIVYLIKPFCRIVVGTATADKRAIQGLKQCGLAGVCLDYDGTERESDVLREYLEILSSAAKLATGACMMREFDSFRQMAVARLAGVTHASLKTAVLKASRAQC